MVEDLNLQSGSEGFKFSHLQPKEVPYVVTLVPCLLTFLDYVCF